MGSGATNGEWGRAPPPNAQIIYKIGIYGWRKRCLYVFLLLLMVIIIINLALTIWIIRVMDFHVDGMGKLRITNTGVRVEGRTEFLQSVYASKIRSTQAAALYLESARNITLNARNSENKIQNRLFIGEQKVESIANRFILRSPSGKVLFSADDQRVEVGAEQLTVAGSSGAVFKGSVQTPFLRSDPRQSLRVDSPTNSLSVFGNEGVHLRAPGGSISIDAIDDITIASRTKAIRFDARNISLKNVVVSTPVFDGRPYPDVYQLCICAQNGKMFLSPARSRANCQATSSICN